MTGVTQRSCSIVTLKWRRGVISFESAIWLKKLQMWQKVRWKIFFCSTVKLIWTALAWFIHTHQRYKILEISRILTFNGETQTFFGDYLKIFIYLRLRSKSNRCVGRRNRKLSKSGYKHVTGCILQKHFSLLLVYLIAFNLFY